MRCVLFGVEMNEMLLIQSKDNAIKNKQDRTKLGVCSFKSKCIQNSANVILLTRLAAASFSVFSNSFPSKLSAFAAVTGTSKLKQNDMMTDSNLLSKAEAEKL